MNWSLDLGMMTTTGFRSPLDKAPNCRNPLNTVPNLSPQIPILHTSRDQGNSVPGDNMDKKIVVLVYYPNPDHGVVGLSSSI
jgi:hypothetical protein